MISHPLILPLLTMLLIASWTDIRRHRIPNLASLGGALLGLGLNALLFGWDGLLSGFYGLGLGLLIFLPFYALGGMGAGDVKLLAAVGAFVGPIPVLLIGICTLLVGLPLGLVYALIRSGFRVDLGRYWLMLKTFFRTLRVCYIPPPPGDVMAARFPYALAILAGTVIALLWLLPPGAPLGFWK